MLEEWAELVAGVLIVLVVFLVIEMTWKPLFDRFEINWVASWLRLFAQYSLGVQIPFAFFAGRGKNLKDASLRIDYHLNRRHFFLGNEERFLHFQILDDVVLVREKLAGNRDTDLAVSGRRENHAVPEAVIIEPGKVTRIEFEAPGRHWCDLLETEKRMLQRCTAEVFALFRFQPEFLTLPCVGRQADIFGASLIYRLPINFVTVVMKLRKIRQHLN